MVQAPKTNMCSSGISICRNILDDDNTCIAQTQKKKKIITKAIYQP